MWKERLVRVEETVIVEETITTKEDTSLSIYIRDSIIELISLFVFLSAILKIYECYVYFSNTLGKFDTNDKN
jgi:hypothetical protein